MNEETTTSTQVDDTQAPATEQPEEQTEQAVQEVEETSETTSSEDSKEETPEETPEESEEDVKAWAEKKGLPLDDPLALAKMVREGDKKVTEATQKATELGKSVQTASTENGADDVEQLKNKVAVMEFYQTFPDARALDTEMSKVLESKPYFANDLEGLYFYTKGIQADKGIVDARKAGSKEALEAVAQAERASAPKASATVRTSPKKITDADIANMSTKEYQEAVEAGEITPFGPQ
jgi:hypothetical protein